MSDLLIILIKNFIGIRELTAFVSALRMFLIAVIYFSKPLTIKNIASLELEHSESDTDFIYGL